MNDDFLSGFRRLPRPEFAQALYAKLARDAETQQIPGRGLAARRAALAAAALCLAFLLAMAASPDARAAVAEILAKITVRGMTVMVNEEIPERLRSGEGETYSTIWSPSSPEEIAADHPFFAKFPAWVPPGYSLQKGAALYYVSMYDEPSGALFQWANKRGGVIQLQVTRGSCPGGPSEGTGLGPDCTVLSYYSVGLESRPQVVAVNDQPAVLFRGVMQLADLSGTIRKWNPSRGTWNMDPAAGLTLVWENEGRTYVLVASSRAIREEDVLRVANSTPP